MAAQPKRKISRGRSGKRRASQSLNLPRLESCSNCGKIKIAHSVCLACGFYKGRESIKLKEKVKVSKVSEE
jgi:large subunit ribosomal protein L32